ncbi:MAG: hypothetical protein K2Q32_09035 [Alphaproteobacteria bacterium]|nr:hypothetical protein [Alphaproteobacteria bacterium]
MCFDISKFFDTLSPVVLKKNWARVLNKQQLPEDHFKVYNSLVNFCYVEETDIIKHFKRVFKKTPRQHELNTKDAGGSLKNRICTYPELRQLDKKYREQKKRLIKNKKEIKNTGIPQGTAISGMLSNIFMIDFDLALKKDIEGLGGLYRRYSDDIFIAVPPNVTFETIELLLTTLLKQLCGETTVLNPKKTEKRIYKIGANGTFEVTNQKGETAKVQYLGFHFDGKKIVIRNTSISKNLGKIITAIRKHKKGLGKINTVGVYKERSGRKITPYDSVKKKGFANYALRVSKVHENSEAISKQIRKIDRVINRAQKRERLRVPARK